MPPRHFLLSQFQPQLIKGLVLRVTITTQAMKHTKRFAPLDPARSHESDAPRLKGIVFDVDGTLWYALDFVLSVQTVKRCSSPHAFHRLDVLVKRFRMIQCFASLHIPKTFYCACGKS